MSEPDPVALLAPSTAARAVALLHEDYHAGKVCFVTDPAECAGHQDAHDITQLLVNAGLLAWGEADVPTQGPASCPSTYRDGSRCALPAGHAEAHTDARSPHNPAAVFWQDDAHARARLVHVEGSSTAPGGDEGV